MSFACQLSWPTVSGNAVPTNTCCHRSQLLRTYLQVKDKKKKNNISKGIILQLKKNDIPVELSFHRLAVSWRQHFTVGWHHSWLLACGLTPWMRPKLECGVFAHQDAGWRGRVDARGHSCTAWLWSVIYHSRSFFLVFVFFFFQTSI